MRVDRLIVFCLLFPAIVAQCQVAQRDRFELPLDIDSRPYGVTSLGAAGVLIYRTFFSGGVESVEMIRLDTTLTQVWRGYVPVGRSSTIVMAQSVDGRTALLLKDRLAYKADFTLVVVYTETGEYSLHSVPTQLPFNPTHFLITETAALIGGYSNSRPLVLHYNLSKRKSRILPGFFNEVGELSQLTANADGTVDIVLCAQVHNKEKTIWIRNFDSSGDLIKSVILAPGEGRHLNFGRVVGTPTGDQMVCGVYGSHINDSGGLFVARIDSAGGYSIKFYNYSVLRRFFNYMKAKPEQRLRERIERQRVKGEKMKFNYRIMVNEVVPYGNQFIMLGEAFYAHYSYSNLQGYDMVMPGDLAAYQAGEYPPAPMSYGDFMFDGFQYTHAVVVGFDQSGKLVWDNSFEINDVRTMHLKQYVKIAPEKDRLVLLYLFDNVIRSKIIKEREVLEGKAFDHLKMKFTDDIVKMRDTESSSLDYWYGNVFFASGIQQVRSMHDADMQSGRRVFFINRIEYK